MKHRASLLAGVLWLAALVIAHGQSLPIRLGLPHIADGALEFGLPAETTNYSIYASTGLANWVSVPNLLNNRAEAQVRDVQAADFTHRFYRVSSEGFPPPTPPQITAQPESKRVGEGESVTFRVRATGTSPLYFRWLFKGVEIAAPSAAQFTIDNVQPSDAGSYAVRVSNRAGSTMSKSAILIVTRSTLAPDSVAGKTITCLRNSGSPTSASSGSYKIVTSRSGTKYEIVRVFGSTAPSIGTYSYIKTSADSATLLFIDSVFGSMVMELTFADSAGGTFVNWGFGGSQVGRFSTH